MNVYLLPPTAAAENKQVSGRSRPWIAPGLRDRRRPESVCRPL